MVRAEEESILDGATVTFDMTGSPTLVPNVLIDGSFKSAVDAAYSAS